MRDRRLFASTFALFVSVVMVASPARSEPAPTAAERAQASTLKKKADEEMESLHYAEALTDYNAAYALTHDPALLYNRSRVLEGLERFAEALDELERFTREAPPALRAKIPQLKEARADLERRVATLTINCSTPDARVLVRDKVVGTTPLAGPIRVNAGSAVVEVIAEGRVPWKQTVELPKAGALTLDVELAAREARGQLVVRSTPEGADVRIDGTALGRAPVEAQLAPGNRALVLSRAGYVDKKTTVVVVENESRTVDITLEKTPGILSKWWFWTGVGVVVAGGVAVTYVLLSEKSAGHGDIPPGQVAGPLRTLTF